MKETAHIYIYTATQGAGGAGARGNTCDGEGRSDTGERYENGSGDCLTRERAGPA